MDVSGVILRQQANLYAWRGVQMTFANPKTNARASLTVVWSTIAHETQGLALKVQTQRPQYHARLADIAALGLAPTDLDGLTVTVEGKTGTISSSAAIPAHIAAAAEIGLNLTGLK